MSLDRTDEAACGEEALPRKSRGGLTAVSGILQILLGLNIAICIICASVTITLNTGALYDADIKNYRLEEQTGMTYDQIRAEYDAVVRYNNIGGPETLEFPTFAMSETGRIHFEEVRTVFQTMEYALIVTAAIAAFGVILSARYKKHLYKLCTFIFALGIPGVIGALAAADWDAFFTGFHSVVFGNEYWIFDPTTDPVITILPDGYFMHCLIMIIGITIAAAAAFLIWYLIKGRRSERRSN